MVSAGCLGSRAEMEVWHVWVGVGVDPSLPSLAGLCPAALGSCLLCGCPAWPRRCIVPTTLLSGSRDSGQGHCLTFLSLSVLRNQMVYEAFTLTSPSAGCM